MRAVSSVALVATISCAALTACSHPEPPRPVQASAPSPATAAAPAPADPAPPKVRLPGDVVPTQYALEFTIIPDRPTATGRVHIAAKVVTATRVVWLNATGLTIASASLDGQPARVIPGGDSFIGLSAGRTLQPGPLTIDVAFENPIDREKSRGMYSEHEGTDTYVYTFFEPIDSRRAFPSFDEPGYKVPWQLSFHVKADHVALGNAPVVRETPEASGMKKVELALSKPLPSYLVAFVVGPFELIDGGKAGRAATPIRFIIPKGRAGELGYAREVTPKVVAALEDYFDMPYPYGKLDVAVVPRYWGTMEHPGIVAMGQPLTLIRPDQATRERKHGYANILAHELSHYWFGDLVTMAWWNDTWLNEALGEWSDMNITEAAEPSWRVRDDRVGASISGMSADEVLSVQPMRLHTESSSDIQASFDNQITYFKGASVFRMFEAYVGREPWRQFIHHYLAAHAWANASADDFLHDLTKDFGDETAAALRSFLEQPGVPKITGELHCAAHGAPHLQLSQTRSLPPGVVDPQPKQWSVPVCLRYGDAAASFKQCVLLTSASQDVELIGSSTSGSGAGKPWTGCPSWTILNADGVGYYRSTVDPAVARALLTAGSPIARTARPTPVERMMLVQDLQAAVKRDEVQLDKVVALAPIVAADPDPKVARYAASAAAMPLRGTDDELFHKGRRWYHDAFHARAVQLGWHRRPGDSEELHELRQSVISFVATEDPALTAEANKLADRWLADRTGVDDDLVGEVLAVSAYHGDTARFDRMLAATRSARDREEKSRLLSALGDFTDPALAQRALDLVLGHDFDLRDSSSILFGAVTRRENRDLGLAFLTAHLDELLGRMRDDEAAGFLGALSGIFCDPDRRAKIAALTSPIAAKFDGAAPKVARGLEQADQCIALVKRELPAMHRLLDAK